MRLLAVGNRDKDIAAKLGISYRTVHHHVERIFRKIQVSSRAAATVYAVDKGLVARGSL